MTTVITFKHGREIDRTTISDHSFDTILRDCGSVGWLGILVKDGKEIYRTGKHYMMQLDCLFAVNKWKDKNIDDEEII